MALELWRWREREAEKRDCPTCRVPRDNLTIDLAPSMVGSAGAAHYLVASRWPSKR